MGHNSKILYLVHHYGAFNSLSFLVTVTSVFLSIFNIGISFIYFSNVADLVYSIKI